MARTADELLEDQEEEEEEEEVESEPDDDEVPYNPKNLPLGWDGKVCIPRAIHILAALGTLQCGGPRVH